MTPEEIIAAMQRGNERFRKGENAMRNYIAEQQATATGQYPAAIVLSCIDSRAPAEVIMNLGIGISSMPAWPGTSPMMTSWAAWSLPAK